MHYRHHAFTLLELAAVLVIVSLMTGFGLQIFQTSSGMDCYAATESQLKVINRAMETFAAKDSRLPKPAFPSLGSSSPRFGMEATDGPDAGDAADDRTVAAYGSMVPVDPDAGTMSNNGAGVNNVLIGALPHSDLGLSVDYASDCWGNKFTYAVTNVLTSKDSATGYPAGTAVGAITLNGGNIASPNLMSDKIDYVVLSHGMNKFGATPMSANNVAAANHCNGSAGTIIDKENCDKTNASFYNSERNIGSGAVDYFDDIVVFGKNLAKGVNTNLYCWGTDVSGYGNLADGDMTAGHSLSVPTKSVANVDFLKFGQHAEISRAAGETSLCLQAADGTGYCWGGNNTQGTIGDGTTINRAIPTPLNTVSKFRHVQQPGGGAALGFAYEADGSAYFWGTAYGLNPSAVIGRSPTLASPTVKFRYVTYTGAQHFGCGLGLNDRVYCWGAGGSFVSLRGNGTLPTGYTGITEVAGGHRFAKLVGSSDGVCALTTAADAAGPGRAFCWGKNSTGIVGDGTQIERFVPTLVADGHTFADIFVGRENTMFAVGDAADVNPGRLYAWGGNANGGLGIGGVNGTDWGQVTTGSSAIDITSITNANPAIVTTATPHGFVNGDRISFTAKSGILGVGMSQLANIEYRVAGATANSFIIQTMAGPNLDTTNTTNFTPYANVSVNVSHITNANPAIVTTATPHGLTGDIRFAIAGAVQWQYNGNYRAMPLTADTFELRTTGSYLPVDLSSLAPYTSTSTVSDQQVVWKRPSIPCAFTTTGNPPWRACKSSPTLVNSAQRFIEVRPQTNSVIGVTDGGNIFCWEANHSGQCGIGLVGGIYPSPTAMTMPAGVTAKYTTSHNESAGCFIGSNSRIYCWGGNTRRQLGDGTNTPRYTPAAVTSTETFSDITLGGGVVCAIKGSVTDGCAPQVLNWGGGCTNTVKGLREGDEYTVGSVSGRIGFVTATCTNGAIVQSNASCTAISSCVDELITWGAGCSAMSGARAHNAAPSLANSAVGYSGSVTATCSNGSYTKSSEVCNQNCIAQTASWGACAGPAGAAVHGAPGVVVANTNSGQVGNVTVTCNNGALTQSGATCAPAPPSNCVSQAVSWGTGCSATAPGLNHGDNTGVSNVAAGRVGTATASCTNGTTTASGTCDLHCTGRGETWGGSCAGNTPAINHSNSQSVSNTNGGFTGAVTMSCTNGTLSQSSASCTPIAPATCAAGWSNPYIYSYEGDMGACLAYTYTIGNCTSGTGGTTASDTGNTNDCIDSITPGCTVRGRICGCLANGQSHTTYGVTGSNPSLCCNGDADNNGVCGGSACSGGSAYGQYVDAMSCSVETNASETCCTSPQKVIYRDHSQNVGSCGLMNWTSTSCDLPKADGQPTWGYPGNCQNGDSDGNGTCGTQAVCDNDSSNGLTGGQKYCSGVAVTQGGGDFVCSGGSWGSGGGYPCGPAQASQCLSGAVTNNYISETSGCGSEPSDCAMNGGWTAPVPDCYDSGQCVCN